MRTISALITLLMSLSCYSQNLQIIDSVQILCSYDYICITDTIKGDTYEDLIHLQIGSKSSKSFSYYTFEHDSLKSTPLGIKKYKQMMRDAYSKGLKGKEFAYAFPHRRSATIVYKNYPEGEMSIMDDVLGNHYIYKDSMELQNWIVNSDSTKTIIGHECTQATCEFRGRKWTAWFALDIPISDGPWKFRGLPGLIMEVYDLNYQYHLCINGIENTDAKPMYFGLYGNDVVFERIDRATFQKAAYEFLRNKKTISEAMSGVSLDMPEKVARQDLLEREGR